MDPHIPITHLYSYCILQNCSRLWGGPQPSFLFFLKCFKEDPRHHIILLLSNSENILIKYGLKKNPIPLSYLTKQTIIP